MARADAFSDFAAAKEADNGGNYDLAIHYYTRAIQSGELSDENVAITFNNRGIAYWNKGEYDRAIRDYDQAIGLKPDFADAFNNRGYTFFLKGEYDRAIREYDQAILLKPDFPLAFNNRGIAYRNKGNYDRAIRDYDQAIRLKPDYATAFNNKAAALNLKARKLATSSSAYERDGEEAVRLAREAVRLKDDPYNRDTLAAAYAEARRVAAAVAEQQRAIKMLRAAGKHDEGADFPTRPDKPPLKKIARDELLSAVIPKRTREGFPVVTGPEVMPGPDDTYIAYGRGWANASNTPFREYKHWVHEGGIATPLIAHWPGGINRHGELEHQPGHLIDVMATCVDIARAKYPTVYSGEVIQPPEGRSLVPAFAGRRIERQAIYWEHEGNRAVRVGKWKLVAKNGRPWELFDMEADRTEMHDLAAQHRDRAEELADLWEAYAQRARVYPLTPWRKPRRASK